MHAALRILGHGIDVVEVDRVAALLERHGERFLRRVFTEEEQRLVGESRTRVISLAGRFAAKEAVLKALGTGWSGGIEWTDVEIGAEPAGRPLVRLSGVAGEVAARLGVIAWHLSISHTRDLATASAIAEGR